MQSKSLDRIRLGKRLLFGSLGWRRYVAARLLFTSRPSSSKTHYDILGLQKNCTQTEIKDSFIRLSKEMHPDKNLDHPEVHSKFVLINEAYSVLSKPRERRMYDAELVYREHAGMHVYSGVVTNAPRERVVVNNDGLWESRDKSEDKYYEQKPYYGIKGVQKMPNHYIAFGAIVFMLLGGLFHFFLAMKSSAAAIQQLDERDRIASLNYQAVREKAMANGNELQMALMRERLEAQSPRRKVETTVTVE